jgi:hypothetical protein
MSRPPDGRDLIAELRNDLAIFDSDTSLSKSALLSILAKWEQAHLAKGVRADLASIDVEKAQDFHIKLVSTLVDKGAAYTNLVILAGYASFFALMPLVKDLLSPGSRRWAGLLMLLSLAAFVGFEIWKMLFMQFAMIRRLRRFSIDNKKPDFDFVKASIQMEKDLHDLQIRFIPVWLAMTTVAILSGFAAVLIPGCSFLISVLEG